MKQGTIFFAGVTKGPNARADGNGGFMARGWYVRKFYGGAFGPFPRKRDAKKHPQAGPGCFEEPVLRREDWSLS